MENSAAKTTGTILHNYPDDMNIERRWREFLTEADFAAHYVSPEYFLEPFVRGKRPFVILVWQGERVVAALSGIHEAQHLLCGLMSRPQMCFEKTADLAATSDALAAALLNEAGSDQLITFYSWVPLDTLSKHGYRCQQEEGVVMLDLTKKPDELFSQFAPTRRTDIRNAIKRGIEVVIADTQDDFRAYYEIYTDWCRRKKIEPSSFEFMEEALTLKNRRLFLARYQGKTMAATIIRLYPGAMIEYAANNSFVEYLKLRPNDLLQWRIVEWACGEGFKRYSLGGAHLFSRRMGGSIAPIYRYRLDRTWLRRYELKEALGKSGRNIFNALPDSVKTRVRRTRKGQE
jgi:hypothetical protein